ncbi:MAG: hypothetical protein HYV07_17495 [Deltaproteobacteria bacterium]|nr:hypothetical protein [Deltaproteobacteria bacterium]
MEEVLCVSCDAVLDDRNYTVVALACVVVAGAIELSLVGAGLLEKLRLLDLVMISAALIMLAWPAFGLLRWVQNRERPVLRELASVYSERFERGLIVGMFVFLALAAFDALPFGPITPTGADPRLAPASKLMRWVLLYLGPVEAALIVLSQGPKFFDFRIKNPYVLARRPTTQKG